MGISVNKPVKAFLKKKLGFWYCKQVAVQIEGHDIDRLESLEIQLMNMCLSMMKQVWAKWLVETAKYVRNHPLFNVNGYTEAGISSAKYEQIQLEH